MKNQTEAIRDFFNDSEWLAIERALGDYQDYGEEEARIADSIEAKIYKLFKSDSLKVTDLQRRQKGEAHLKHFNRPPIYESLAKSHRTRCESDFF